MKNIHPNISAWTSEMTLFIKVLDIKPKNMSLIPVTHSIRRELTSAICPLASGAHCVICAPP